MPFIGNKPSAVPLTSADITDNIIVNADINTNAAITTEKLSLISTASVASVTAKGTPSVSDGYIQLNCEQNSHGIKIKSPPHSAGANYTLVMPSATGTSLQSLRMNSGATALEFATLALGITEADTWRLTADKTDNSVITANLERDDTSGFGYVGTGMTQSSGIFTFPSTGIYLITAHFTFTVTNENQTIGAINTTINNSSYTLRAEAFASSTGTSHYKGSTTSIIFDVTSTANCKLSFELKSLNASCGAIGGTTLNYTNFVFIRLGDT